MSEKWKNFNDHKKRYSNKKDKERLDELRTCMLGDLEGMLRSLFPAGKIVNGQFVIGDIYGSKGDSLKVTIRGDDKGLWHDFATGEGGDVFDLWAAVNGKDTKKDFPEVLKLIKEHYNIFDEPTKTSTQKKEKPKRTLTKVWKYYSQDEKLIATVSRYDAEGEKKVFYPFDAIRNVNRAPDPRPLYNQLGMKIVNTIVLVEGEKCADALNKIGITATTAMNGAMAPVDKTDWSPLKGKKVILWPDNDDAGKKYSDKVGRYLIDHEITNDVYRLTPPKSKPDKWDVADAVEEDFDVREFIETAKRVKVEAFFHYYTEILEDNTPVPKDLISPRFLTPGGTCVIAGAPKVGKSDFLINLFARSAAGEEFLGLNPARPLNIYYFQLELQYPYLKERLQNMAISPALKRKVGNKFVVTEQTHLKLDEEGVERLIIDIKKAFRDTPPDIICIDPIRNCFDAGDDLPATENDNSSMLFFIQERIERIRQEINPNACMVLCHHTKKIRKKDMEEDPFLALSGASSLRGIYTSCCILYKPNEHTPNIHMVFELRNGPPIPKKAISKNDNGEWIEENLFSERIVNQTHAEKLDAERERKRSVILNLIREKAAEGKMYVGSQFAEAFENTHGLGSRSSINERLSVHATKSDIRFVKHGTEKYNHDPVPGSKYGYMCVEDMLLGGEDFPEPIPVLPTHYKCPKNGAALPVKHPEKWTYFEVEEV